MGLTSADTLVQKSVWSIQFATYSGRFPGSGDLGIWHILLLVLWTMLVMGFCRHDIMALVRLPYSLYVLVSKRRDALNRSIGVHYVLSILDPLEAYGLPGRRTYDSISVMMLGMVVVVVIIVAFVNSMYSFFTYPFYLSGGTYSLGSHKCEFEDQTAHEYIVDCLPDQLFAKYTRIERAADYMYYMLFQRCSIKFHIVALVLLFLQALSIINFFPQTAWIGHTLHDSVAHAWYFLLVLMVVICGVAYACVLMFGGEFEQFSTFGDAMLSLFTFTFGIQEVAEHEHMQATFWPSSVAMTLALTLYSVIIIFIFMNVLLTIIIDRYASAKDMGVVSVKKFNVDWASAWAIFIFPNLVDN